MAVFDMATDALLYYYGRALAEQQSRAVQSSRALLLAPPGLDWLYGRGGEFSNAPDGIKAGTSREEKRRAQLSQLVKQPLTVVTLVTLLRALRS